MNPFVTGLCKGVLRSPLKGARALLQSQRMAAIAMTIIILLNYLAFFVRTELHSKFVGANFFPAKNPVDARREVVSTLFCCGRKANLVWFTLFYSTLLALTHGQKDGQRLEYTRFAWAGGTFFPVVMCCCFSFLFWREIGFGFTYYLCT